MAKQVGNTGRQWYVVQVSSGHEDSVAKMIKQRSESMGMQDYIFDAIVPKEKQMVVKRGVRKMEEKKILSGYVLIEMIVTDESWFLVRNTPNIKRVLGAGTIPIPVTDDEFKKVKKHMGDAAPKVKMDFMEGDPVVITKGPFATYEGQVTTIDPKGKVIVTVSLFGRDTPVELEHDSVKKR